VTKVVRFLDYCPDEKVFVLSGAADAAPAAGLAMLPDLSPAAIPAAALPPRFSESSSHKSNYTYLSLGPAEFRFSFHLN
jgi:hypothetical protein